MRGAAETRGLSRRSLFAAAGLAAGAAALPAGLRAQVAGTGGAPGAAHPAIRLSLNENALGPSPAVAPAIAAEAPRLNRYLDDGDVAALTARIAAQERVPADQILVGEVLAPLGQLLARQKAGGGIVFSTPGYTELVDAAAPFGGRAVPVPLNRDLANDLPALERAVGADTIAVSLVNPHNPSGTVDGAAEVDAFVARVAPRALVIVDEAYLEYSDDFARLSAIRHVRAGANVLIYRTFAKVYGLAGLAIGYAAGPASLLAALRKEGVGAPHSLNRLSLAAAGAAIADQDHVARVRAFIGGERRRLGAVLDQLHLRHSASAASFVFFDGAGRAEALRQTFQQAGIEIARPFPPLDSWLRITIGTAAENDAVIATLRRTLA